MMSYERGFISIIYDTIINCVLALHQHVTKSRRNRIHDSVQPLRHYNQWGLQKSREKLNWLFAFPECVSCSLGLFQAAVVISYTTYLTWSALSHEPDDLCNPPGYVISGYDQNTGLSLQTIVSGVFVFVTLIYASVSTAMSASKLSKFSVLIDYRLIYFVIYSRAQHPVKNPKKRTQ